MYVCMYVCMYARNGFTTEVYEFTYSLHTLQHVRIFFWTRFEKLIAKQRKINDRVVPILVAIHNWNDVICLSRSAAFPQCVVPCHLKTVKKVVIYTQKVRG